MQQPGRDSQQTSPGRRVISVQSFHLPLPHHVDSFNAFERAFSRLKPLEALRGSDLLFDKAVVLFDDIVEIFNSS
jgi:hypothetical protein